MVKPASRTRTLRRLARLLAFSLLLACGCATPGRLASVQLTDGSWQVWVHDARGRHARQVTRGPIDRTVVHWFPDGDRLVTGRTDGKIEIVDLSSGEATVLPLDLDFAAEPVVSPDGRWIAFSSAPAGEADTNDIWVVRPDGSDLHRFTGQAFMQNYPAWCPCAPELVFVSGTWTRGHNLYRARYGEGRPQVDQATHGLRRMMRPDCAAGGLVVFSAMDRAGIAQLWVLSPGASSPRLLTRGDGSAIDPSVDDRGRRIAWATPEGGNYVLVTRRLRGGRARHVDTNGRPARAPDWAPRHRRCPPPAYRPPH